MMAFVAGIMLLAASAVTVIPPFPFTSYASVVGARPTGATMCDGEALVVNAGDWRILSTAGRDIFLHFNVRGEPDFVYFVVGTGDPIKVRMAMTIEEARVRYPDPCVFFLEKDV